ncbi:hypothetical protein A0H81_07518 [Grifola frondosa]|uniref:Uncharacterized protein n=1 Tax=Grifola frondosa TaxID=5627 RepID=A0A1C7M786_GRIFR|nr:hypothetical protein A0H81_07518 [Grifola frondosa]
MSFYTSCSALRAATQDGLVPPSVKVHFCPISTRSQSAERKVLRSPPAKHSARACTAKFLKARSFSSSRKKKQAAAFREIRLCDDVRRAQPDWVPIAGFRPHDHTLLPLVVAQQRTDIAYRAFPRANLIGPRNSIGTARRTVAGDASEDRMRRDGNEAYFDSTPLGGWIEGSRCVVVLCMM